MVVHAAEVNRSAVGGGAGERGPAVVPLSGQEGGVPCSAKLLDPGRMFGSKVGRNLPETFAGEQAGPAGNTDGRLECALNVGAGEGAAAVDETVEMRGDQIGVAEGVNPIGLMIVAEEKEDIGAGNGGGGLRSRVGRGGG